MRGSTARSPYANPAFIAAVAVLLPAALGLNIAVPELKLYFKKLPVPLMMDLKEIPAQMGDWMQVSRDEPLDKDLEEVLGTGNYIFRDYLDITAHDGHSAAMLIEALHSGEGDNELSSLASRFLAADPAERKKMFLDELKDKTLVQRRAALAMVQRDSPDAVVNVAVTYYTGLADTVAHIPDRCYVADGFEPSEYEEPNWALADGRQLGVRFINFQDAGDTSRPDRNVAYFFHVNGVYVSNPEAVRLRMQNLFQRYGYYLKVELMTMDPDHDRSSRTMIGFLNQTLAEVEKTYPDWKKFNTSQGK